MFQSHQAKYLNSQKYQSETEALKEHNLET